MPSATSMLAVVFVGTPILVLGSRRGGRTTTGAVVRRSGGVRTRPSTVARPRRSANDIAGDALCPRKNNTLIRRASLQKILRPRGERAGLPGRAPGVRLQDGRE